MDQLLIENKKVTNSEDKESEEAAHKNQHEDAREGTSRPTSGVQSKKTKSTRQKDEHREFQEKWKVEFLFCSSWHDPSVLIMQTNTPLFHKKQLGAPFQNSAFQNSTKVLRLAAN